MDGLQIRNFRQNQGMSLRAFGKQVGVSYERVRQLETYDYISPEIQERICAAFNVDSADPLFLTTPNPAPQPDKKTRKAQAVRKKEEQAALKPVRAAYAREIRMKAGLSQKALAAAMGTSQTQISAWECGQHFISDATMERIEAALRIQCEQAARNDAVERNRISADLYDRLKKGRKAHDVTGDIYVALFYQENAIEGLNIELTSNANAKTQTEL